MADEIQTGAPAETQPTPAPETIAEKAPPVIELPEMSVTVQEMSRGEKPADRPNHPNTVAFKVQYPKDYPSDKKGMKDGDIVYISKEVAEKFIKLKIGSIVK